jgi:predicted DNA-binding transcriptional regulator YafY
MTEATFTVNEELVKDVIALAVKHKKQVRIGYLDKKGNAEVRIVEPFDNQNELNFGGHCTLRKAYRNFSYSRVVRIALLDLDHTTVPPEPKK